MILMSERYQGRNIANNMDQAEPIGDFVTAAATIGAIAAGVALFEVALIPGMAIGAAAVLAPKYVPKLGRRLRPLLKSTVRIEPALAPPDRPDVKVPLVAGLAIKQVLAKTVTFQIIVTTLDFTAHYVIVGNFATALSLSASHLVIRPLYYFFHEAAWNYLSPPVRRNAGLGAIGHWSRLSPIRPLLRPWTSLRTMLWSATSRPRRRCRPSASWSVLLLISATRWPGTTMARLGRAASIYRHHLHRHPAARRPASLRLDPDQPAIHVHVLLGWLQACQASMTITGTLPSNSDGTGGKTCT
jgi:uncharacterized membrane protein